MPSLPPTLHPFLSNKPPWLARLHPDPGTTLGCSSHHSDKEAPRWLGMYRYFVFFWSLEPSLSLTNLLLSSSSKGLNSQEVKVLLLGQGPWDWGSRLTLHLRTKQGGSFSTPSPSLHTTARMEVPERERLGTKVAFTQSLLRGDSCGSVCSPEAGCHPVTLSSKMCEISFCWVFYIKRNLFSEKHSISQTLMAFLCADALMRLRLVLIRRKPCR